MWRLSALHQTPHWSNVVLQELRDPAALRNRRVRRGGVRLLPNLRQAAHQGK